MVISDDGGTERYQSCHIGGRIGGVGAVDDVGWDGWGGGGGMVCVMHTCCNYHYTMCVAWVPEVYHLGSWVYHLGTWVYHLGTMGVCPRYHRGIP